MRKKATQSASSTRILTFSNYSIFILSEGAFVFLSLVPAALILAVVFPRVTFCTCPFLTCRQWRRVKREESAPTGSPDSIRPPASCTSVWLTLPSILDVWFKGRGDEGRRQLIGHACLLKGDFIWV